MTPCRQRKACDAASPVVLAVPTTQPAALIPVAELVVPPRSSWVGETVFPGMAHGAELVVLGVRRRGEERGARPTELEEGDSLLVHGSWAAVATSRWKYTTAARTSGWAETAGSPATSAAGATSASGRWPEGEG